MLALPEQHYDLLWVPCNPQNFDPRDLELRCCGDTAFCRVITIHLHTTVSETEKHERSLGITTAYIPSNIDIYS